MARHERWTAIVSAGLIFGALLACKKKGSDDAAASASAAQVAPPPATTAAATGSLKLGDVKRYSDKEKKGDEGAVRVLEDDLKVFNEADSKTPEVATLPKDALVFRLAEVDNFELVEFPSGIGQFSQGWVEKKSLATTPEKVAREAVLTSQKVAKVKTDGGAPSASGSASGSASASASASVAPKPSASTPPTPPPPPKPTADAGAKKKKKKKSGG
jgi:hypothetical protein